jgi:hypothetical protein
MGVAWRVFNVVLCGVIIGLISVNVMHTFSGLAGPRFCKLTLERHSYDRHEHLQKRVMDEAAARMTVEMEDWHAAPKNSIGMVLVCSLYLIYNFLRSIAVATLVNLDFTCTALFTRLYCHLF